MFWKKNLKIDGCLCFGATIFSVTSSGEMYFGKKKKKKEKKHIVTNWISSVQISQYRNSKLSAAT